MLYDVYYRPVPTVPAIRIGRPLAGEKAALVVARLRAGYGERTAWAAPAGPRL